MRIYAIAHLLFAHIFSQKQFTFILLFIFDRRIGSTGKRNRWRRDSLVPRRSSLSLKFYWFSISHFIDRLVFVFTLVIRQGPAIDPPSPTPNVQTYHYMILLYFRLQSKPNQTIIKYYTYVMFRQRWQNRKLQTEIYQFIVLFLA